MPGFEERIQRRVEAGLADTFSRGAAFALCANELVHARTGAPGMPSSEAVCPHQRRYSAPHAAFADRVRVQVPFSMC